MVIDFWAFIEMIDAVGCLTRSDIIQIIRVKQQKHLFTKKFHRVHLNLQCCCSTATVAV